MITPIPTKDGYRGIDCRHLRLRCGSLREGDFVVHDNSILQVIAIGRNCPYFDNLYKHFTEVLLENPATGARKSVRGIDLWEVFRIKNRARSDLNQFRKVLS